jgi:phosphatidylglycerol---prolipoprotein diacylglyceryl transferase
MLELFNTIFAPPRHLILLVLALWIGLSLAERRAEARGVSKDYLNNLVFYSLVAYVFGGRIAFVFENYPSFIRSPLDIVSISPTIFDPLAAIFCALLAGVIYAVRLKLSGWALLDALTPVFAVLAVGLALSHLAAQTAYGSPTELPWGIEMRNATRHPSQIYELIASLLTFGLIWFQRPGARPGTLFLTFTALTAGSRLFLEAFRGDSHFDAGGFRSAQLIALAVLSISFLFYEAIQKKKPNRPLT